MEACKRGKMDRVAFYVRYTILGIICAFIFAIRPNELLTSISIFVFMGCVFFIIILAIYDMAENKITFYAESFVIPKSRNEPPVIIEEVRKAPETDRYVSQERTRHIGQTGQSLLSEKTVSVIGLGSIGAASAELLARAGIGNIYLIDNEKITMPDLQDHALFTEEDVGMMKSMAAEDKLKTINSKITVQGHRVRIKESNEVLLESDIILDCTNDLSVKKKIQHYTAGKIPWIFCITAHKLGFVKLVMKGPCWDCIYKELEPTPSKATLNPTIHMGSSIMVTLAIQYLLKKSYEKDLIMYNVWNQKIQTAKITNTPKCKSCRALSF